MAFTVWSARLPNVKPKRHLETLTITSHLFHTNPPPTSPIMSGRLSCRMYANKFPEVDDLVMVNVRQIAEMGAYVQLLEYDNIEGMILLSELSRRRIRSIQKLIRVGKNEVVVVLRVDKEKGMCVFANHVRVLAKMGETRRLCLAIFSGTEDVGAPKSRIGSSRSKSSESFGSSPQETKTILKQLSDRRSRGKRACSVLCAESGSWRVLFLPLLGVL